MQAAVYAVELSGEWEIRVSLDMDVDRLWWSGTGEKREGWNTRTADKLVILSSALPLGWAVKLRESWSSTRAGRQWQVEDWRKYMTEVLKGEIAGERDAGGSWCEERLYQEVSVCTLVNAAEVTAVQHRKAYMEAEKYRLAIDAVAGGRNLDLGAAAELMVKVLEGRSLLEPEVEALLAERLPGLAGQWRAAAQLAQLQGRLRLEAAVGKTPALRSAGGGRLPALAGRFLHAAALRLPQLRLPRRGAATARRAEQRCLRCGSAATGRTACAACGLAGCAYCEACLALGRSRACALLLRSASSPAVQCTAGGSPTVAARRWGLSAAQAGAAGAALGFLAEPRQRSAASSPERFLLWAVTGAGKTEITFPLLEAVLAAGGRALVATPRRDVVLELAPRLARAFPAETLAVLYGGSADRWIPGQLTLATTHQLLRFHQSFDLVIIDELDAYPYHNDPMLAFAAEHACKPGGSFIYLSATPPEELQRLARSGKLPHARVPVRFHGHPLPVPQHLEVPPLQISLQRGALPAKLLQALRKSFAREAQIFLFVSRIAHIERLLALLRQSFSGAAMEGTSSQDPARTEKVAAFRSRSISLLVTTTILERGVTVPRSDVLILDADSSLFDEASLVQMAGRAGRSKEDPAGTVVFLSPQWTKSQRGAVAQIRTMNTIARRQGYLDKEERR
ncbi:DEAD/DEAH box helicase [Paenibacillus riograndensis]|uniref:ComF operon protein 1 n=2 Tax=Paenibacillus riograndensis TaxID=483937 RepID=A0A0E3WJE2_9BACL|nr:DNA/RNA helicase [Paenibacillus riograndensis]CQR58633.1 ComF operon protein 1 [Paenibacillus riograndensis SBR5]